MISKRSLQNYISTNLFLLSISTIHFLSIEILSFISSVMPIPYTYPSIFIVGYTPLVILTNYLLINIIDYKLKNVEWISPRYHSNSLLESGEVEKHLYVFQASVIESFAVLLLTYTFPALSVFSVLDYQTSIYNMLLFIPYSFIFEITFDFFHYVAHRCCHTKYLYKFHKTHHKYSHPTSIITFYQDPLDIIISNVIPFTLTFFIFRPQSLFIFMMLMTYKKYTEIAGHSGKNIDSVCAFPQFMWLPKLFNIQLHTKDHDLHHTLNNCNYSKRFMMWDKVFGTARGTAVPHNPSLGGQLSPITPRSGDSCPP